MTYPLRTTGLAGSSGHINDHFELHRRHNHYVTPEDFGGDPTGVADSTAAFAAMDAYLVAKGGGVCELPDPCLYRANAKVSPWVSWQGGGMRSRIQGVAGAGIAVVNAALYQSEMRNFAILGTLPYDGSYGSNSNPEVGLWLNKWAGNAWYEPRVENIDIGLTRGPGLATNLAGGFMKRIVTGYTGGSGIYTIGGTTDTDWVDCLVGTVINGVNPTGPGIFAIGLQDTWHQCQVYAQGQVWGVHPINGSMAWFFDKNNHSAVGWALGFGQECIGCRSEDSPIGVSIGGTGSRWIGGSSGGDRIPVLLSIAASDAGDNVYEGLIQVCDRSIPICGVQSYLSGAGKNRFRFDIDWDAESFALPYPDPMRDTGTIGDRTDGDVFRLVDIPTLGTTPTFNGNDIKTSRGGDVYHSVTDGALNPDVRDGKRYFINNPDNLPSLTINNIVDRRSLTYGEIIEFIFDRGVTVTWGNRFANTSQPVAGLKNSVIRYLYNDSLYGVLGAGNFLFHSRTDAYVATVGQVTRATGDLSLTAADITSWNTVPSLSDIVLQNVHTGDWIEVAASGIYGNQASIVYLDVASIVSGAPVNSWGASCTNGVDNTTGQGIVSWESQQASQFARFGSTIGRAVTATDIAADGSLTLRLRFRMSIASTPRTLFAQANVPFAWQAKNLKKVT